MPRSRQRILLIAVALLAAAPASAAPLAHMVFFTLKEDTPETRDTLVEACQEHLSGHEGTLYFSVGAIADELKRDVNDREFDIALHLVFESRDAHDRYQEHPRHLRFIEEIRPLLDGVRVFDSHLTQTPKP